MHRHWLIAIFAFLALAGSLVAQREPGVTLYRDADFRGPNLTFYDGNEVAELGGLAIGNDTVSSVRVDRGCRVTLYEHADFRGRTTTLTEDAVDLYGTEVGDDQVSSFAVECGSPGRSGGGQGARQGVFLYADVDYRGREEAFYDDDPSLDDNYLGRNNASSVRVGQGCRVTLYDGVNFRGDSVTLTEDTPDLRLTRIGNDRVSSLEVECRRPGWYEPEPESPATGGVTLYADEGYYGRSETFDGDDPDLRENPIGNDTVSSMRVAPGCRVVLYKDIDYRGTSALLTEDTASMRSTAVGNDQVSSLEVFCDRQSEGVTLYEHRDYEGRSETFLEDDPQLDNNAFPNDGASSVRVAPGCTVTLYQHANYDGRSTTLREDAPDLRVTSVGNDTVSSLRVECRRSGGRRPGRRR